MEKLDYEILKEYSHELSEINHKLDMMERGRIYELSGAQMDGYLATNVSQLRGMINDLLNKIQNGGNSNRTWKYHEKSLENIYQPSIFDGWYFFA